MEMRPSESGEVAASDGRALAADTLTATRALLGVAAGVLIGAAALPVASFVVAAAWLTDALDGRLARSTTVSTRLGGWDMHADVLLGSSIALGLAASGRIPPAAVAILVVLVSGFLATCNPALGMLAQLVGHVPFLLVLWWDRPAAWWAAPAAAVAIGIVDGRQVVMETIPKFLRGMAAVFTGRRVDASGRVVDEDRSG